MWLNEVTCYCYTPIHIQIWISFYSSTDLKQSDARIHWNFSLFGMIVSSRILLYSSWKQYYTPDATILMQLDNMSTLSSGLVHSALPLNVIPWSSYSISRKSHLKATENAVRIYWSSKKHSILYSTSVYFPYYWTYDRSYSFLIKAFAFLCKARNSLIAQQLCCRSRLNHSMTEIVIWTMLWTESQLHCCCFISNVCPQFKTNFANMCINLLIYTGTMLWSNWFRFHKRFFFFFFFSSWMASFCRGCICSWNDLTLVTSWTAVVVDLEKL